ncbi:amino acid ABC transporter permease [Kaistia dalseonensis]|uniref:Polar amino acid transport system permease protein n=1 Tax=Kaistia dalseonensis TaxID=410840 RepID=A0ABU0H2V6_9HYPH|nr:amino acid ABC transporter permease [Kaistia dalseonensis]MCX5494062.1 amino acid ABC transporter permease [Kaistia dalseonensis]MDQ0436640.1 polar amino acid transport system permease protein [Kaistia dalseonensis]
MNYVFQFGPIFQRMDELLYGALRTMELTAASVAAGLVIGILGALGRSFGPRWLSRIISAYVEIIRNTPLLIQLYFVFFSLPLFGLRLSSDQAAILALSIHLGAYATEILRAGVESIPAGQIEAAKSLGLSRRQIIRHVILVPAARAVYPALTSQFILQLLGTSIVSAIAAEELTAVANNMAMQTFRNFEIYIVIAVIYFVLVQGCSLFFRLLSLVMFRWKM